MMILIKLFRGEGKVGGKSHIFLANAPGRFNEPPVKVLCAIANDGT